MLRHKMFLFILFPLFIYFPIVCYKFFLDTYINKPITCSYCYENSDGCPSLVYEFVDNSQHQLQKFLQILSSSNFVMCSNKCDSNALYLQLYTRKDTHSHDNVCDPNLFKTLLNHSDIVFKKYTQSDASFISEDEKIKDSECSKDSASDDDEPSDSESDDDEPSNDHSSTDNDDHSSKDRDRPSTDNTS